ncbi:hypothetical protein [Rhodopirellula sp. MGV]|uniref:hypothetical protein n=1 Tax=Rhodopirellula sp. MGV TaxID=2023130 RepID=UPI000B95EB0B|nr:hypothetical protein [Rhodopirellula sp. MGV]OYP34918.1 hypothetical protein CGZ80_12865 [Rhodopirellula sp. MGV]PNY38185.1 hypothetical protein C2E31_04085 [Rhodopirellula baltica]
MSNSAELSHRKRTPKLRPSARAARRHRWHARRRKREFVFFCLLNLLAILAIFGFVMSYRYVARTYQPVDPGIIFGEI